jgi:hypothetical protein
MIRTRSYIFHWNFEGCFISDRSKIGVATGGAVVLRAQRRATKLPGRKITFFPTDSNLFVRTIAYAPSVKKTFDFIEIDSVLPKDLDGNSPTSVFARIHDGADPLYWNGAAWSVATSTDWNTETEINANLSNYTGASLAIEINLRTTDEDYSPAVRNIGLRWKGKTVNVLRALVYSGIVNSLKQNIRPVRPWVIGGNGTTSIAIDSELGDSKYKIAGAIAAFNHSTDPTHETDLLVSFAGGVATLSGVVPSTESIWFELEIEVNVAVTTSSDFKVAARIPAIWITQIIPGTRKIIGVNGANVLDRTLPIPAGTVYLTPIPFRDVEFSYVIITPSAADLLEIADALDGWMTSHPVIKVGELDLSLCLQPGYVPNWDTSNSDEDDTRLATGTFSVKDVPAFNDPRASSANDSSATVGPVDAGDPNHPGVGYGISRMNMDFLTADGGDETKTVE